MSAIRWAVRPWFFLTVLAASACSDSHAAVSDADSADAGPDSGRTSPARDAGSPPPRPDAFLPPVPDAGSTTSDPVDSIEPAIAVAADGVTGAVVYVDVPAPPN